MKSAPVCSAAIACSRICCARARTASNVTRPPLRWSSCHAWFRSRGVNLTAWSANGGTPLHVGRDVVLLYELVEELDAFIADHVGRNDVLAFRDIDVHAIVDARAVRPARRVNHRTAPILIHAAYGDAPRGEAAVGVADSTAPNHTAIGSPPRLAGDRNKVEDRVEEVPPRISA